MLHSRRCEDDDASKVFFIRIIELIVTGGAKILLYTCECGQVDDGKYKI